MRYVFVDFEMNLIDSEHKQEKKICKSEIIEIGAVKLDDEYNEIDSFKSYVKPAYGSMASRIIKLTGITDEMLETAPSYEDAVGRFIEWCADADVIYAWSENDLRQLRGETRLKQPVHQRRVDLPVIPVSVHVKRCSQNSHFRPVHPNNKRTQTIFVNLEIGLTFQINDSFPITEFYRIF